MMNTFTIGLQSGLKAGSWSRLASIKDFASSSAKAPLRSRMVFIAIVTVFRSSVSQVVSVGSVQMEKEEHFYTGSSHVHKETTANSQQL